MGGPHGDRCGRAVRFPRAVPPGHERDRLTVPQGLAALSLDAMASVAYGPEAIVVVLAVAGSHGLGFTLPVTIAIVVLLAALTFSYRQVIAAFPNGGGAYAVAGRHLGRNVSLVAAASLIVDYVLNVAVSVAAGVAALTSAYPSLYAERVPLCVVVLALLTGANLYGIAESARILIVPTVVFVVAVFAVMAVGLVRPHAAIPPTRPAQATATVGLLLLLRAFASGCAALTGVEAIANAVPTFRTPRVRRAQRAELLLGSLLSIMLLGLSLLISKFHVAPNSTKTVLAQLTDASLGHNILFYIVQFATVVLLALAANTSFGGLPVLASLLARDNNLPHLFALRADRQVYRYGVLVLSGAALVLLLAAEANTQALVPFFAIAVFVGFTISQIGMVRHWREQGGPGWQGRAVVNGIGAVMTAAAGIIEFVAKFAEGGWVVFVAVALSAVRGRRLPGLHPVPVRHGAPRSSSPRCTSGTTTTPCTRSSHRTRSSARRRTRRTRSGRHRCGTWRWYRWPGWTRRHCAPWPTRRLGGSRWHRPLHHHDAQRLRRAYGTCPASWSPASRSTSRPSG